MQLSGSPIPLTLALCLVVSGCAGTSVPQATGGEPEKLIVHADGSMEFRDRPVPEQDVIIYEDGYGGERAAIRIRMEPVRSDFFRDTIVVERK